MIDKKLDSIGTIIVVLLAFLLPIFFIPLFYTPLYEAKVFLLIVGVFVSVFVWGVARLKENKISVPREMFLWPLIAIPFVSILASLFSGNIINSLIGQSMEVDTSIMYLIFVFSFGVGVYLLNSKDKIVKFYLAVTVSALILFLYQIIRLTSGAEFLSFNIFFGNTANLLGKWNDLAIFAGLISLLSLITLDTLRPSGILKVIFYLSFIFSLIILVIVNFSTVWLVLCFILFLLFIRSFLENRFLAKSINKNGMIPHNKSKTSAFILIMLVLSILFLFTGSSLGRVINNQFGILQIEARPSWQSTLAITDKVYSENILFGVGPNNFKKEWLLHKPTSINNTPFWNTDFLFGVGIIPTIFITHGIFSAVAWILFLALFFWAGIRSFVRLDMRPFDNYLSTSSFFSAIFLWILSVFYVPHVVLFFFAFLFSGVFLAVQIQAGVVKQKTFSFSEDLRVGFIGIILIFILLISSVAGLYSSFQKFASAVYIQKANIELSTIGDIKKSEKNVNQALIFNRNDSGYRLMSEISLFKFTDLINKEGYTTGIQQQLQSILTDAIENGRIAISKDDKNYQNWSTLGKVYETLIPIQVDGAYENARASYDMAYSLNPKNPTLALNLARTEFLKGNNQIARERIAESLLLKNDYTDAIYLLSQIEINEGNVQEAISSIETATLIAPQNPLTFFQLGILKYSQEDYGGAIEALNRAILLNNKYSNALYFLGLSYYKLGLLSDAINQFSLVRELNRNNEDVLTILDNLRAGREPFENFSPPEEDPLKGPNPPLEE